MKKNAQLVYHAATRNKFNPTNITFIGTPTAFVPTVAKPLRWFLRGVFRAELEEARERIEGHRYIPSKAWRERATKLATGKTY